VLTGPFFLAYLFLTIANTGGSIDTSIMMMATSEKFFSMKGTLPNQNPQNKNIKIHDTPPTIL
jgi:hypothetical protein